MAAVHLLGWDEQQAYDELLYWDSVIQRGHRLLPEDYDRYDPIPPHARTHAEHRKS